MANHQVKLDVPPGAKSVLCRGPNCQAPIFWVRTQRGRNVPVNLDGSAHRDVCPDRDMFRTRQALTQVELAALVKLAMDDIRTFNSRDASFLQSTFVRIRMNEFVQDWENLKAQKIIRSNPVIKSAT